MTYVFKIFTPEVDETQEGIVQSVYNRERDMHGHIQTLEKYKEILKDKNFVGRVFEKGDTFRNKIEREIPVLEGAIEECLRLISVSEKYLPNQEKISEIKSKIKTKENIVLS